MDWDRVDTAKLLTLYYTAPSASALYERLRRTASALDVLARCSPVELGTELRALLDQPVSTDRNARAYALLVALALYGPETARKMVLDGTIDHLRWGQAIVNAADADRLSMESIYRRQEPQRPS